MADFPSALPDPQSDGYEVAPVDQTIRTQMEVGAPRSRRRTAADNDQVSVSWLFTESEMSTFRAWFTNGTTGAAGGASWFNVTLWLGNGSSEAVEARFLGGYKFKRKGASMWFVVAQIEVR